MDPAFYAHRERPYTELLPWNHLASGHPRDLLERHYNDVFVKLNIPHPTAATA